ncbi:hypothetical protein R3W88_014621 [Solanum pinnatisectum]|uniref:Piezo non-specific cation channel cap domain-containing protein n=1 Tax=Solanum pinnatisectum TaxID=50273 RepID=A0AAV9KSZ5_9SOLN|nr:hypothetical protein R3W88_014621 [Solanum pinnatisectum]
MIPFNQLNDDLNLDPNGYLYAYNINDIQLICCQPDANTLWLVLYVVQRRFVPSLQDIEVKCSWVRTRDRPKGKKVVKYERTLDPVDSPKPWEVKKVLNSTNSFRAYNLYPRYIRVTGSWEVRT